MNNIVVQLDAVPVCLHEGLVEISRAVPLKFAGKGMKLSFSTCKKGLQLSRTDANSANIAFETVNDAFRGIGILLGGAIPDKIGAQICESRKISKTFVMLDVSRNGVLNPESVASWLRFMALAGVNGFMLYTEDTYEIDGEPMFGYMRGAYSKAELRAFDDIANSLGIEMIPCIQTLAHLQRILQYPRFNNIKDTSSVMLCEEPETIRFVEKMLAEASAPYRSDRIHIGMDEAWDLGRGQYLSCKGFKPPFELMTAHLKKVLQATSRLKLRPMMWSDMFFRALSDHNAYYDHNVKFTEKILRQVPKNVDLVYWDYYHFNEDDYSSMIDQHVKLNGIPIMAPGIQTWNRFWTCYDTSLRTIQPGLSSCISKGVQEIVITIWGDDGTECDYFSAWPLIQFASDIVFSGKADTAKTKKYLMGACGVDFDAWAAGGLIDHMPGNKSNGNISKTLLWDDPVLGLWQPQKNGARLNAYYSRLATRLSKLSSSGNNRRLLLPALLANVLALKADFPEILQQAYLGKNRQKLELISSVTLPEITRRVKALNVYHRKLWLQNHKPFGWEVLERRYGGLLGTLDNLKSKLSDYLAGKLESIPELEVEKQKIFTTGKDDMAHACFARLVTTGHYDH